MTSLCLCPLPSLAAYPKCSHTAQHQIHLLRLPLPCATPLESFPVVLGMGAAPQCTHCYHCTSMWHLDGV